MQSCLSRLTKTRVLGARVEFHEQKLLTPFQISSGLIEKATEARVVVRVSVDGQEAEGRSSIYLSDFWAWPDPRFSHEERDAALRERCREVAQNLGRLTGASSHPLELGLRLHKAVCHGGSDSLPALALALCTAPFDAAIHDAAGRALGVSAFAFYQASVPIWEADYLFPDSCACAAITEVLRPPKDALEAWWLVSVHDDLNGEFARMIQKSGFRCFKIKILGKDISADVTRTTEVFEAALRHGVRDPQLSLDSNEAHADAGAVMQFLDELHSVSPEAYRAVFYLEQPTGRDIEKDAFDWRMVTRHKPIFLDEGLSDFEKLPLVLQQGWSGLALKTCKGHSFSLVAAAWAHANGLSLTMQDLTNPGYSAIHSWIFAAHLPVINGVELNSPQFTPQANVAWLPRMSGLFEVRGGVHRMNPYITGLGSGL